MVSLLVIRLVYIFKKATDVKTKSAAPTTVGEMLLFEFLKPLGISAYELSIKMDISYKRMIDILQNESSITEKECLSLSVIFNTDGTVSPSEAPGVGLDINREALADFRIK